MYLQNLASIQPRTSLVKFALSVTVRVQIAQVQMLAYHYAELFRPALSSPLNGVTATPRRDARSAVSGFKVPGAALMTLRGKEGR